MRGMENALRTKPLEVKVWFERQIKDLQEAYGEAMLELRARKMLNSMLGMENEKDPAATARTQSRRGSRQPGQTLPVV